MNTHADRDRSELPGVLVWSADGSQCDHCGAFWVHTPDCPTQAPADVPAGPPLHEPTDRDADNVPSDGSNAWECDHHPEMCDDRKRCHHPDHLAVRAEKAEAEVARLRATIARVEALAEQWAEKPYPSTASAGWNNGYDMAIEEAEDALRTALRDPEPTEETP